MTDTLIGNKWSEQRASAGECLSIQTMAQLRDYIKAHAVEAIKVAVTDPNGVMRGKYLGRDKFLAALDKGFGFCDVIAGWDYADEVIDGLSCVGWSKGFGDQTVVLCPESTRVIPHEPNSLLVLAQFEAGADLLCPRSVLQAVIERAQRMGFYPYAAMEYEFTVMDGLSSDAVNQPLSALQPWTRGVPGYSVLRSTTMSDFYHELMVFCRDMRIPIEGLHTENGQGMLEAAIQYDHMMESADRAVLFKTFTKAFGQRRGLLFNFMAKWRMDQQGQGAHIHLSLRKQSGENVFHDSQSPGSMPALMRHFLAGQQQLLPEWLVMMAPTVNAFARMVPGYWAPTQASWGIDNRTCALRVIEGGPSSQRIEYRVPGADCNPYLAMAAALASGLYGIEHALEPSEPMSGNAYTQSMASSYQFPRRLDDAAQRFSASTVAKDYFGETFARDFSNTRIHEQREADRQVTDWQLNRYMELV